MGLFDRRGHSLPAMAHHASEVGERVRNVWMGAERLRSDVAQRGLFHCDVTGSAAVHHAELRDPSLLHAGLEPALESNCIAPASDQPLVSLLVEIPLAEVISRGDDGEGEQQNKPQCPERTRAVSEQCPSNRSEPGTDSHYALHGHTQDQPGPRKNVPIKVRIEEVRRNHVMIQNDSGLEASHPWFSLGPAVCRAATIMHAPITSVGASTA